MSPRSACTPAIVLFAFLAVCARSPSAPAADRLVLAFYYTWYGTPWGPSGRWVHWPEGGHDPTRRDERGYRDLGAAQHPLDGPYDSHDEETIRRHARWSEAAGIDGWISTWWGRGDFHDRAFEKVLAVLAKAASPVAATVYYETSRRNASRAVEDLVYILEKYGSQPRFLRAGGRPVIFIYGRAMGELRESQWREVVRRVRAEHDCLLVADTFDAELIALFGAGHRYNPVTTVLGGADMPAYYRRFAERCRAARALAAVTVLPGYDDRQVRTPGLFLARRRAKTYHDLWRAALDARPDWVLITTFNEWHEGTEIEPSREHGTLYLEFTRRFSRWFRSGRAEGVLVVKDGTRPEHGEPPEIALRKGGRAVLLPDRTRAAWVLALISGEPVDVEIAAGGYVGVAVPVLDDPAGRAREARPAGGARAKPFTAVLRPDEELHLWREEDLRRFIGKGGYRGARELHAALRTGARIVLEAPGLGRGGVGRRIRAASGTSFPLRIRAEPFGGTPPGEVLRTEGFEVGGVPGFRWEDGKLYVPAEAEPGTRHTLRIKAAGEKSPEAFLEVEVVKPFRAEIEAEEGGLRVVLAPQAPLPPGGEVRLELRLGTGLLAKEKGRLVSREPAAFRIAWKRIASVRLPAGEPVVVAARYGAAVSTFEVLLAAELDLARGTAGRGLRHVGFDVPGDGRTRLVSLGGTRLRETLPFRSRPGYMYFDLDDRFPPGGPIEIEVVCASRGARRIALQYDSRDANLPHGGAYKEAGRLELPEDGGPHILRFRIEDARFRNAQNFGADFRLHGDGGFAVAAVRVRAGPR